MKASRLEVHRRSDIERALRHAGLDPLAACRIPAADLHLLTAEQWAAELEPLPPWNVLDDWWPGKPTGLTLEGQGDDSGPEDDPEGIPDDESP